MAGRLRLCAISPVRAVGQCDAGGPLAVRALPQVAVGTFVPGARVSVTSRRGGRRPVLETARGRPFVMRP